MSRQLEGPRLHWSPTTKEAVVQALRHSIASGVFRPGEGVYQDAIAEQLGVSRLPVREALNVLWADGPLEHSRHWGCPFTAMPGE